MDDLKEMKSWKYNRKKFYDFLQGEYGQLDKKLRERINWGCKCHFRIDKVAWDTLNAMFDYVIELYYKGAGAND